MVELVDNGEDAPYIRNEDEPDLGHQEDHNRQQGYA